MSREAEVLEAAVREAGAAVERIAAEGYETARKARGSPVTEADLEANRILHERLLGAFPGDGWLSEETRDDPGRLKCRRVWVVDPIDGTKEFIKGLPEYAVSVALVGDGEGIFGAVYNPRTDEYFSAAKGEGAKLNGETIRADRPLPEMPAILASRTEIGRGEWKAFEPFAEVKPVGSIAYKLALIAAGRADGTFSLGPKNEWDIAAGVVLVREAGGRVMDRAGEAARFNNEDPKVNGIVAATASGEDAVLEMIRRVEGRWPLGA